MHGRTLLGGLTATLENGQRVQTPLQDGARPLPQQVRHTVRQTQGWYAI